MVWNRVLLRRLFWLASFAWMGLIFWFSAQNAEESAESSGSVMTFLLRLFRVDAMEEILTDTVLYSMVDFTIRKSAHFAVFCILGLLLCVTISLYPNVIRLQKIVLPLTLGILYACIDELHQYFVPGRACQIRDVCIDTAGVLMGVLLVMGIGRFLRQRRMKKQALSATDIN